MHPFEMTDEEVDALVGADAEPGVQLGGRALKRQALDEIMARAMSGLLPRNRQLKSWEPDVLDERHMQAILMRSTGLQQQFIARSLGWTDAWTSIVLNHPDAQYILTKIVSYAADEVLDVHTRIKAHAGEALDKVVEVMRTTQDGRLASSNAFELLKMAGFGAVEKKEIKQEISMPVAGADLLAAAIAESRQVTAAYRIVSGPGLDGSEVPASPGDSGISGVNTPPVSDVQDTETLHDGSRVRVA